MDLQDFQGKWLGKRTDQDGVFGYQCVDLIKQFAVDVLKIKPGAWGDAIDYWTNTKHPLLNHGYTRVATQSPKRGDIVILNPTSTNRYGHIGIATDSNTMLEQNGATGDGDGQGGDEIRYRTIPKSRIAGVLRPKAKEEEFMKPTKNEVDNAFNFLGVPDSATPKEKNYAYYMGQREKVLYTKVLAALYAKWKSERSAKIKAQAEVKALKEQLENGGSGNFVPVGELYVKKEG